MLKSISFKNFKCFNDCTIPLKNITVLAGQNGCGKSTVIQSLLLLKQSYDKFQNLDNIIVSGEYINLGNSSDIINEYTEESEINISIITDTERTLFLNIPYEANMNLISTNFSSNTELDSFSIFQESFE